MNPEDEEEYSDAGEDVTGSEELQDDSNDEGEDKDSDASAHDQGADEEENESHEEEEADPRFVLHVPEKLKEVESFSMPLPGHGSESATVVVNLSEPKRSFQAAYRRQLESLRKDSILRQLSGDAAAIKEFLKRENEAAMKKTKKKRHVADGDETDGDGSGDDDDDDAGSGKEKGGAYHVIRSEEGPRGGAAAKEAKGKAMRDLSERLLRRRPYPHWLPPLLANDAFHFAHTCKAMYGYAVPPPPLPAAAVSRRAEDGGASAPAGGAGGAHRAPQSSRAGSRAVVSFRTGSRDGSHEVGDEEDEHMSLMDPARKASDFFLKSNAFAGDAATDYPSEGHTSRYGSNASIPMQGGDEAQMHAAVAAEERGQSLRLGAAAASQNTDPQEDSGEDGAAEWQASTEATAAGPVYPLPPSQRQSSLLAPMAGVPAFTDANFPIYIVWETESEAWHLLDVHPDVHIFRAKQALRRRQRAAERRRQQQQRAKAGGIAEEEEEEEETDSQVGDADAKRGSPAAGDSSGDRDDEDEEGEGDSEGGDADSGERAKKKKRDMFDDLLRFEKDTMVVVDALTLAALRCPAALRLMLLQDLTPLAPRTTPGDVAGGEEGDEDEASGGQREKENFMAQVAATETLVSLRCIEDWMATDFTTGFPLLSTVYSCLLSIRALDAPRLPYAAITESRRTGLLFDVNLFFTDAYVFSQPGARRLVGGGQQGKSLEPATRRLERVASPRSEAAQGTMQSLLHVGLVPRHPIARERLTTPESLQLMVWLMLMIPAGLLTAWGLAGKQEMMQLLEEGGVSERRLSRSGEEEEEEEEEEDGEGDGSEADDLLEGDVEGVTEVDILERILAEAQARERKLARERRRRLRTLKKRLGDRMPAKKTSISVCDDTHEATAHPTTQHRGEHEQEATARGGIGNGADLTWETLTTTITALEKEEAEAMPFLPGALLVQAVLELRRRIALEDADRGPSLFTLAFVLEKHLAALFRCVEDGKPTGDAVVTTSFHTAFPPDEDAAAPQKRVGGEPSISSGPTTRSSTPAATLAAATAVTSQQPNDGLPFSSSQHRLLRKQVIYQSDLVLLLLALTTTSDGERRVAPSLPLQQPQQRAPKGRGGAKADVVTELAEYPADGHAELFRTLLHAKLRKQAGTVRAGSATASLLDKVRSGMFRLLFLALPRFSHRATMQMLCDAAPMYELLGANERVPLMDLVHSWSIEQDLHLSAGDAQLPESPNALQTSLSGAAPLLASLAKSTYADIFVRTFWSEIAYRLEAGVFPAGTIDKIRALNKSLLDKVYECVAAYNKVVYTLVSGKLLKHSVINSVALSAFAVNERSPQALKHLAHGFPKADSSASLPAAVAARSAPAAATGEAQQSEEPETPSLLHILSPYSDEFIRDEERVRALFRSLPMVSRTVFTPELLFAMLFTTNELDVVAVRYVCTLQRVQTVRQGGPFALRHSSGGGGGVNADPSPSAGGGSPPVASLASAPDRLSMSQVTGAASLTATTALPRRRSNECTNDGDAKVPHTQGEATVAAGAAMGREVPALEYALRIRNVQVAKLLVVLGFPLDELSFGGACTLETLAERTLTPDEVESLRIMARQRQRSMKTDPDSSFGVVRAV